MRYPIPKPTPHVPAFTNTGYPLYALGDACLAPVAAHHAATGIAGEMIATAALSGVLAAVQDLFDVQRPNMRPSPCGDYFFVVANSGDGKDTASAPFIRGFKTVEEELALTAENHRFEYEAETAAWNTQRRVLQRKMDEAALEGDDMESLKREYAALASRRPKRQGASRILHDDATPVGLQKSISGGSHSVFMYNPEAGGFLTSGLGSGATFMNGAWDSKDSDRDRGAEKHSRMFDYRISALLMVQPVMLQKYLARWGAEAKGNGLTARMLFAAPPSTLGLRFLDPDYQPANDGIDRYADRVVQLLQETADRRRRGAPRYAIPFSPAAANYFISIFNEIQQLMAPFQVLHDISGHAAKAPEHIARIACGLHAFEGREGPIDVNVLQRAHELVRWHVNQFFMLFASGQMGDPREWDIKDVSFAVQKASSYGFEHFSRNELSGWCEGKIPSKRLQAALVAMVDRGLLKPKSNGQRMYYQPTPALVWRPALPLSAPSNPRPASGAPSPKGVDAAVA